MYESVLHVVTIFRDNYPVTENYIQYEDLTLHYEVTGNGQQSFVLFHGFGQESTNFSMMAAHLRGYYTVYSFDLFFHGNSNRLLEKPLDKNEWKELMKEFFERHQIITCRAAAYSMGCKFLFSTFEFFPEKVVSLFLIAPDGIKINPWYTLATRTALTRGIFKLMIRHHQFFLAVARVIRRAGLIDPATLRFAEGQMNTEVKRRKVYLSWVIFRRLKFDIQKLTATINNLHTEVIIVVGKSDTVIAPRTVRVLADNVRNCRVEILEKGHQSVLLPAMKLLR